MRRHDQTHLDSNHLLLLLLRRHHASRMSLAVLLPEPSSEPPLVCSARSRAEHAQRISSNFVRPLPIPFFNVQMRKGVSGGGSVLHMGTAALSGRDYAHFSISRPDTIVEISHDA
jgi:acetolactate synthase I/II/III large subunit